MYRHNSELNMSFVLKMVSSRLVSSLGAIYSNGGVA